VRFAGSLLSAFAGPLLLSAVVGMGIHAYLRNAAPPPVQTVGEAVVRRAGIRMIELVGNGADPKLPIAAAFRDIASGQPVKLTPLALAAANGDRDFVQLLLLVEIPWTEDEKRDAYCAGIATDRAWIEQLIPNPGLEPTACRTRLERLAAS
jgi:hypothetical protein